MGVRCGAFPAPSFFGVEVVKSRLFISDLALLLLQILAAYAINAS